MPRMLQLHFFMVLLHVWFGPVQNQEIQRLMKRKVMRKTQKEVLFLRKRVFSRAICSMNYLMTKSHLQKEFKPSYRLWPYNIFLHLG